MLIPRLWLVNVEYELAGLKWWNWFSIGSFFFSVSLIIKLDVLSTCHSTVFTPQWYYSQKGLKPLHCELKNSCYLACTDLMNFSHSVQTVSRMYRCNRAPIKEGGLFSIGKEIREEMQQSKSFYSFSNHMFYFER